MRVDRVGVVLMQLKGDCGLNLRPVRSETQRIFVDVRGWRYLIRTASLFENRMRYGTSEYKYIVWPLDFTNRPKDVRYVIVGLFEEDILAYVLRIPAGDITSARTMVLSHLFERKYAQYIVYNAVTTAVVA